MPSYMHDCAPRPHSPWRIIADERDSRVDRSWEAYQVSPAELAIPPGPGDWLAGPVRVHAVGSRRNEDGDLFILDQVQHPVLATAGRVLRSERFQQRLTDPAGVLRQRSLNELPAGGRYLLRHPL